MFYHLASFYFSRQSHVRNHHCLLVIQRDILCHLSFVGIHDMPTDENSPISVTKYDVIPSSLFVYLFRVPCFRIWGDFRRFPCFRILSHFPWFWRSAIPRFRLLGSPLKQHMRLHGSHDIYIRKYHFENLNSRFVFPKAVTKLALAKYKSICETIPTRKRSVLIPFVRVWSI